jgi:hypothetical protein
MDATWSDQLASHCETTVRGALALTDRIAKFGEGVSWLLPSGEVNRQAIAPLRGYVYQIHQTLSAWITLGENDQLYVEIAEDFATVARDPERLDEVLTATQVKDTRESGSVTLNSSDVLEAIAHLLALQKANPGRVVRLTFLTTSNVGKEIKLPLPSGRPGIAAWQSASSAGDIEELRAALCLRLADKDLGVFLRASSNDEFHAKILTSLTFVCGSGDWKEVEAANRAALSTMRNEVKASLEMADRAYDTLFAEVFKAILSNNRMLDRRRLLDCFARATAIGVPSQVLLDHLEQIPISSAAVPVDDDRLRELSQSLLELNAPPSILALFPDLPEPARDALTVLSAVKRTVVWDRSQVADAKLSMRAEELLNLRTGHQLIIAPPGAGKSQSLWQAAKANSQAKDAIPLYLSVGRMRSWKEVIESIQDLYKNIDVTAVLRHERAFVCLDGWSEFAEGEKLAERAKAMRTLHGVHVIANGRSKNPSDTTFESWHLEPLMSASVKQALKTAYGSRPLPDPALHELLRSPLVLSLYILLGVPVVSPGQLLERLHRHLSQTFPGGFDAALCGAVASLSLSRDRSYARLLAELRDRAQSAKVDQPVEYLTRLGTITERGQLAVPIHDLYWSWLSGVGLLQEDKVEQALLRLDTRESLDLAFQSKAKTTPEVVRAIAPKDLVLAADFEASLEGQSDDSGFDAEVETMFASDDLSVRYRAALAGLHSRKSRHLARALNTISDVIDANLFPLELLNVFRPANLFPSRGILGDWLGSSGTEQLVDAIATQGGPEWEPWLEQVMRAGKLDPSLALGAALACSDKIPSWGSDFLEDLIRNKAWKLRPVADRGSNTSLAAWIAAEYEEIAGSWLSTGGSRWIDLNRVLVACGSDAHFESLLSRFSAMPPKAQEILGYAVVERGDPWIGRFQKIAFAGGNSTQHHRLSEQVSLDIDDDTARHWISVGQDQLGWRVLIKRHGNAVLPELIERLPQSFGGLDHIPSLAAMSYLDDPPESLAPELWSRIRGTMLPKAMEDVLLALARIVPGGVPSIVQFCVNQRGALPNYHVAVIVRLYAEWRQQHHAIDLVVRTPTGDVPFPDWALKTASRGVDDKALLSRGFRYAPDVAVRVVLSDLAADDAAAKQVLEAIQPLERHDAALFSRMIGSSVLAPVMPNLFSEVFDAMSADEIRQLVASPHIKFETLIWRLSKDTNPLHKRVHTELIERVMNEPLNLHHYRNLGDMLRGYSRDELREMMRPIIARGDEKARWLLRQIEYVRRERLINEAGELLT